MRTDVTQAEFASVRVEVFEASPDGTPGSESAAREVSAEGRDWFGGVRLMNEGLRAGDYVAFLRLLDAAREPVCVVPLRVTVRGAVAHTFRVSRDCLGQEMYDPPTCTTERDCDEMYECGVSECSEGICLYLFDNELCDSRRCTPEGCIGEPDAGTPDVGVDAPVDVPLDVPPDTSCPAGFADCNDDMSDGCEVGLGTVSNCVDCGDSCATPDRVFVGRDLVSCESGGCVIECERRLGNCNGVYEDGCETDLTSPDHCGDCLTVCSGATPVCGVTGNGPEDRRVCVAACADPVPINCAGTCIAPDPGGNDILYSPSHCTGCGMTCGAPDFCCNGCCNTRGTSGCTLCGLSG